MRAFSEPAQARRVMYAPDKHIMRDIRKEDRSEAYAAETAMLRRTGSQSMADFATALIATLHPSGLEGTTRHRR